MSYRYYRPSFFHGFRFFPSAIKYFIIINVIVYLFLIFFGLNFKISGVPLYIYIYKYFALNPIGDGFKIWQLITYMFIHDPKGIFHILFNMLMLWMFGTEVENLWGTRRFLVYYSTAGIGAGITHLIIAPLFDQIGPVVGASGAIYGIMTAFAIMFPDRMIFLYFLIPIPARIFVAILVFFDLIMGIFGSDGIAHFAHLGGAVVGFIYIKLMYSGFDLSELLAKFKLPKKQKKKYLLVDDEIITQEQIDEILDKINQYGYESLTEREKKILYEASKKLR
ncbi:Membrane associated serine protease, rhomboid family [Candidatus Thermokryptus mobilis]|uniref:Membrane associated serine protease, rhomboid family n=1 Tax=Candidatus Thermokryptus mobilis TaxID=1643428 RepID=A0A0S4N4X2_9BACT|nr:rhomboid family intramembrane serine protease [Candidatus Thermokryptus mobilis]CUU05768.1 Membrane associated serine protease, rhomboid family [Candidatus Thermokryptus mobilis]